MAVLLPGKALFLAHPRTGSIATRDALVRLGGQDIRPHHAHLDNPKVQLHYRGEPVVCTVRNPYDVVATWWVVVGRKRGVTMTDFILNYDGRHFATGGRLMFHVADSDHVLRYEDGITEGFARLGIDLPLEPNNVTQGKGDWDTYFSKDSYNAMAHRFGHEIEDLGYQVIRP